MNEAERTGRQGIYDIDPFGGEAVFSQITAFGPVEIREKYPLRWLHCGTEVVQGAIDVRHPWRLILPYTQAMAAIDLFIHSPERVLMLGAGVGSLARFLRHRHPQAVIDGVDRNPVILHAAEEFFETRDLYRDLMIQDAATAVAESSRGDYDVVFVDVCSARLLPRWIVEQQFYRHLERLLALQGAVVVNLLTGDEQTFLRVVKLARRVFHRNTLCFKVPGFQNIILFAFNERPQRVHHDALLAHARQMSREASLDYALWAERVCRDNPSREQTLLFEK